MTQTQKLIDYIKSNLKLISSISEWNIYEIETLNQRIYIQLIIECITFDKLNTVPTNLGQLHLNKYINIKHVKSAIIHPYNNDDGDFNMIIINHIPKYIEFGIHMNTIMVSR